MRRYTERIDFALSIETKELLRAAAKREGVSMGEIIRRRVRAAMDTEPRSV
jgi:hypothetical protein